MKAINWSVIYVVIFSLILFSVISGCSGTSVPSTSENDGGIIYAKILKIQEGEPINNSKTALITIDKGSQDGISQNLIGWIRVHKAALLETHVVELTDTTTVLTGWWYDSLSIGQSVLVTEPDIDTEIIFQLTEEQF
jgi:hypothetical protein